jgi:hypothetical protein
MGKHSAPETEEESLNERTAVIAREVTIADNEFTHTLFTTAFNLLGDGEGGEWDNNPEYSRAIFELVGNIVGADCYTASTLVRVAAQLDAEGFASVLGLLMDGRH